MNHARGVDGDSAKLARIGEYATGVRMTILLTLLECFSALVLAVALYGITRDVDQELAMLAMACGVAESVLGSLRIPDYSGLLWLAKAGVGTGAPDIPTTHEVFGITSRDWQSFYHFTVGGHVEDVRLTTLPPYAWQP
jgi:hypothetical protein